MYVGSTMAAAGSVSPSVTDSMSRLCGFYPGQAEPSERIVMECDEVVVGQVVSIEMAGNYLTLCEVEVYGRCFWETPKAAASLKPSSMYCPKVRMYSHTKLISILPDIWGLTILCKPKFLYIFMFTIFNY